MSRSGHCRNSSRISGGAIHCAVAFTAAIVRSSLFSHPVAGPCPVAVRAVPSSLLPRSAALAIQHCKSGLRRFRLFWLACCHGLRF